MKIIALLFAFLFPASLFSALVPDELTIEVLIDGSSSLYVTPDGIYWKSGNAAKPGKWGGRDEPTYVNGVSWIPKWAKPRERAGADRCEILRPGLGTSDVTFELLTVSKERGGKGKENRTAIGTRKEGNAFIITIPDPEPEGRWYKFIIRKNK